MKKILGVVVAMAFATVAFAGEHAGKPMEHAGKAMETTAKAPVLKPTTVKWEPMGEGLWMSYVQGDPKTGPFTMYLKMKAGAKSPWHTHDADYSGVVVEGNCTHQDQGAEIIKAVPGQAWVSKGGVNHQNTCNGKKDCVVFIASMGAQTFTMMTADGKKMEQPAPAPTAAAKTN